MLFAGQAADEQVHLRQTLVIGHHGDRFIQIARIVQIGIRTLDHGKDHRKSGNGVLTAFIGDLDHQRFFQIHAHRSLLHIAGNNFQHGGHIRIAGGGKHNGAAGQTGCLRLHGVDAGQSAGLPIHLRQAFAVGFDGDRRAVTLRAQSADAAASAGHLKLHRIGGKGQVVVADNLDDQGIGQPVAGEACLIVAADVLDLFRRHTRLDVKSDRRISQGYAAIVRCRGLDRIKRSQKG
ncbi:MAG: hypothetical protein BWY83_00812 [bacterium ADurb.Bin478]|nr:MAG: hypothetical protein BWY83_00812 [bacterium ADurb.Bin478]